MPTGYTAKLMDKGQTFQEFVLTCARAFGALVTLRNESWDTPIPDKFEPSDYYPKRIIEAEGKLAKLKAMTGEERIAFGEAEKAKDLLLKTEYLNKEKAENERLEEMESQVRAWQPPTNDHKGLKDFMLQQIDVSKNDFKYPIASLEEAKNKLPMAYYVEAVSKAARDIDYYKLENEKDIERVNGRNEWLRQLRQSI
jgi:hypothetical protein